MQSFQSFQSLGSRSVQRNSDVPQGSILGPLLFLLHFNEAEKQLIKCKIITYSDDTVIYCHDKNLKSIGEVLSKEFNYLSNWLEEKEPILIMKKGKAKYCEESHEVFFCVMEPGRTQNRKPQASLPAHGFHEKTNMSNMGPAESGTFCS